MVIKKASVGVILWAVVCLSQPLGAQPGAEPVLSKLSLDQLTDRAASIVVSTVTGRRPEWITSDGSQLIVTHVTLQVEQVLKGSPPRSVTIDVLGGTIGDRTLTVSHVPEFRVGDRDVLFLHGVPRSVSPLVGSDQGRFRVLRESASGAWRGLTAGWKPLRAPAAIQREDGGLITALSAAMTLEDFSNSVRDTVRRLERPR